MSDETENKSENVYDFQAEKEKLLKELESGQSPSSSKTLDPEKQLVIMNKKHAFINSFGGKPMVMSYVYSPIADRDIVEFRSPDAITVQYSNQSIQVDRSYIPLGKWWLQHGARREYDTVIFDPSLTKVHKNCLNLYQGLAIEPKEGSWRETMKHLYLVLCNGDREKFKYTLRWFAWCLQNPGEKAEVVVIFKGKQGGGKGFIFKQFTKIFGEHGLHISNREHLTGKHNGHLRTCVFLFADEAYYPGDKEVEGAINQLITEDTLAIEDKYVRVIASKNCLHIGMATNADWVIPAAGGGARRYYINSVSDKYAFSECNPSIREQYFNRIYGEMSNGGREAMAYDLVNWDLKDWHPRFNIPVTEEFITQVAISLKPEIKSMASFLEDAHWPGDTDSFQGSYKIKFKALNTYITDNVFKGWEKLSSKRKSELLHGIGGMKYQDGTGLTWEFPELPICKKAFQLAFAKQYPFDNMEYKWTQGKGDY